MKVLFIPFFIMISVIGFSACENPLALDKKISVTVNFPDWPPASNYPELDYWRITVTDSNGSSYFCREASEKSAAVSITKNCLTSIYVQPVIKSEAFNFFCPAAAVYPVNFSDNKADSSWELYPFAKSAAAVIGLKDSYEKKTALNYFNWKKLSDAFLQKQNDSFSTYDSKKTKTCTTGFNTDFEKLTERIITPPARFTIPYENTSCIVPEKIKGLNLDDGVLLNSYIPLNKLLKEKGCVTVQTSPSDHKTAFLLNNKVIYVQNKKLYLE